MGGTRWGAGGRGGRAAGREHCMRSPASNGVTCRLCRNTAAPPLLKKTNFAPRPPSKVKLSFFAGCSRSALWMSSRFGKPERLPPFHFVHVPPRCPIVRSVWRFSVLSFFHGRLRQLLRALCSVPCVLRTRRSGTEPAPATFGTPRETSLSYLCPAAG